VIPLRQLFVIFVVDDIVVFLMLFIRYLHCILLLLIVDRYWWCCWCCDTIVVDVLIRWFIYYCIIPDIYSPFCSAFWVCLCWIHCSSFVLVTLLMFVTLPLWWQVVLPFPFIRFCCIVFVDPLLFWHLLDDTLFHSIDVMLLLMLLLMPVLYSALLFCGWCLSLHLTLLDVWYSRLFFCLPFVKWFSRSVIPFPPALIVWPLLQCVCWSLYVVLVVSVMTGCWHWYIAILVHLLIHYSDIVGDCCILGTSDLHLLLGC